MCNLSNEVPQLFDWDQEKNQPADRYLRAELNSSIVEFVAPTEYMVRFALLPSPREESRPCPLTGSTTSTTTLHLHHRRLLLGHLLGHGRHRRSYPPRVARPHSQRRQPHQNLHHRRRLVPPLLLPPHRRHRALDARCRRPRRCLPPQTFRHPRQPRRGQGGDRVAPRPS